MDVNLETKLERPPVDHWRTERIRLIRTLSRDGSNTLIAAVSFDEEELKNERGITRG